MAARGHQICHRRRSFGRGRRRPRPPPKAPHPHGWTLARPASPPSADYLHLWCFANHWAEVNRTVLHKAQESQGHIHGSIAFGVVLFLVLIRWSVFGIMAESYGFALLFSFWPTAAVYLQKNSTIGWIFQHPYVTSTTQDRDDMNVSNKVLYSGMPWWVSLLFGFIRTIIISSTCSPPTFNFFKIVVLASRNSSLFELCKVHPCNSCLLRLLTKCKFDIVLLI